MKRKIDENQVVVSEIQSLQSLIYVVRGVQVMLDCDLAALYGYTTKDFNRQVKNNIEKFDEDFRFQLTFAELDDLRCKISTSSLNWGGSRYLPYAFTEQGVYMLMTVLRGELATRQSKAIVRTFKKMKDYIVENRNLLGQREFVQLSLQTSRNVQEIADLKGSLSRIDDKVAGLVDALGNVVTKSELADVMLDFGNPATRRGWLILNGQPVESDVAYARIYGEAKSEIYIIDNYIGLKTLVLAKDVLPKIKVTVFSDNLNRGLHKAEYEDFCREYGALTLKRSGGIFHDRYIILDPNTKCERVFHCGASSKDGGARVMTIEEVADISIYRQLILNLSFNATLSLA